jgi:hypothetical protein
VPIYSRMTFASRHAPALAVVAAAFVAMGAVFLMARPVYHGQHGTTFRLPKHQPAADADGARGWSWPEGLPGWKAGERIDGYLVSGVQPVELGAARLSAARFGLDSDGIRVLVSTRANTQGALAIVAAPTLERSPTQTCLGVLLQGDRPVRWRCPTELAADRVLVAAARYSWTYRTPHDTRHPLYLVGVARGDVRRVVLEAGALRETLYTRGSTWGEFSAAVDVGRGARLQLYGRDGLAQTLPLDVKPGTQRVVG